MEADNANNNMGILKQEGVLGLTALFNSTPPKIQPVSPFMVSESCRREQVKQTNQLNRLTGSGLIGMSFDKEGMSFDEANNVATAVGAVATTSKQIIIILGCHGVRT